MEQLKRINRFPQGSVRIPPSKSVTHRAMICAALGSGASRVTPFQRSDDMLATLACIEALGARTRFDGDALHIQGGAAPEQCTLDCAESGSTLRFMLPIAAALGIDARFVGRGRLLQRPMTPYFEMFAQNGAELTMADGALQVSGRLRPGTFRLRGDISSQFVSGLLFALPLLDGDSVIVLETPLQSAAYVTLTLQAMRRFGVTAEGDAARMTVKGSQSYRACDFCVESDYSQAAFFLVAGALGRRVECLGLNAHSAQSDKQILSLLERAGAQLTTGPGGGIIAEAETLLAITADVSEIPDLVPPLAALLTFAEGTSRLVNASRLRLKESDRLHALASELSGLGADVREGEDFLEITGSPYIRGGKARAHGDHRIAMAIAVAAIRSAGDVFLSGSECVSKSYPEFWRDFEGEDADE